MDTDTIIITVVGGVFAVVFAGWMAVVVDSEHTPAFDWHGDGRQV